MVGGLIIQRLKTDKGFNQLAVMLLLAGAGFGMVGVVVILFYHWIALQRTAVDLADKHGISTVQSSRLGGVAVILTLSILFLGMLYSNQAYLYEHSYYDDSRRYGIIAIVLCALLGLIEDIKGDFLSPGYRLAIKLIIFAGMLQLWPEIVPQALGVPGLDYLLSYPVIGWILTTIFLLGFINAVNMADGANGLMPGIAFCAAYIFYLYGGRELEASLMSACGLFLVYNVITGRLFLGDAGTYGLGTAFALYGLYFHNAGVFSPSFLAALFAYPCIDFLVSIARRLGEGRSPFSPDNDHLHNRLHRKFQAYFQSPLVANSATGLSITLATSGVVLMGSLQQWWPVTSNAWAWVFIAEVVLYGAIYYATGLGRPPSQLGKVI